MCGNKLDRKELQVRTNLVASEQMDDAFEVHREIVVTQKREHLPKLCSPEEVLHVSFEEMDKIASAVRLRARKAIVEERLVAETIAATVPRQYALRRHPFEKLRREAVHCGRRHG